jgi:CHAD domain-containing protein
MKVSLRTSLESNLLNQKTRFLYNAEALFLDNDPEIIHQIRLSLKMIRSIMGFLGFVSPAHDFNRKYIVRLNKTFRLSGKLRDEQIQLQNLRHLQAAFHKNFKQYEKYLKANIEAYKKQFCARMEKKKNNFIDKLFIDFFSFLYSRTDKEIYASYHVYLEERYNSLQNSFAKHPVTNLFLHNTRKQLKDFIHLLIFTPEEQTRALFPALESLKQLDQELGNWHDLVNTRDSLKKFLKTKPELMNRKVEYSHLLQFIQKEIQLSRKTVTTMMEELSSQTSEARGSE